MYVPLVSEAQPVRKPGNFQGKVYYVCGPLLCALYLFALIALRAQVALRLLIFHSREQSSKLHYTWFSW